MVVVFGEQRGITLVPQCMILQTRNTYQAMQEDLFSTKTLSAKSLSN